VLRNCSARWELISLRDSFMESEEREYLAIAQARTSGSAPVMA
jgi:hypothetical protein